MPCEAIFDAYDLAGRVAVVTGAGSGIGKAVAFALARRCGEVCLVGRDASRLAETASAMPPSARIARFPLDLTLEADVLRLRQYLEDRTATLDILVHCAAVLRQDLVECAPIEDFDLQYATNVRAPYRLTQLLLPLLRVASGQIVFVNSSVGLTAKRPGIGQYAATKHALKAVADSLREEVNSDGIRVLTVYLGRVATPMQEALHKQEGKPYHPENLLQPADVATVILQSLMLPYTAEITDISIRPMRRPA